MSQRHRDPTTTNGRPSLSGEGGPPNMTRSTSYVLVSSSLSEPPPSPLYVTPLPSHRPRYYFLLPVLAAIDAVATCTLAFFVCREGSPNDDQNPPPPSGSRDPAAPYWDETRMVMAVAAVSVLRGFTFAIVGFSKRIRELGIIVAAICILSALYNVSAANILFQARGKPDIIVPPPSKPRHPQEPNATSSPFWPRGELLDDKQTAPHAPAELLTSLLLFVSTTAWHFAPSIAFLIGSQMAFTLVEWMLYIGVIGVRVPPGGNPVKAKRWARTLASDSRYKHGVDAASLYATDSDNDGDEDDDDADEDGHDSDVDLADNEEDGRPLAGQGAATPAGTRVEPEDGRKRPTSPFLSPSAEAHRHVDGDSKAPLLSSPDERTALQSPKRGYGAAGTSLTPQRQRKQSREGSSGGGKGSIQSLRSPTIPFPADAGRDSPRTAELGLVGRRMEDLYADQEADEDGDTDHDPDDIIDISSDRRLSRHASRRRLALAAHPERRISGGLTLGLGGAGGSIGKGDGDGGSGSGRSTPLGIGIGFGSGGLFGRQKADGSSVGGTSSSWTATKGTMLQPGLPRSVSTSASQGGPSLASHQAATASAEVPTAEKKHRKLPAWLSRSKTSPARGAGRADGAP